MADYLGGVCACVSPTRTPVHTVVRDLDEVLHHVVTHKHASVGFGETAEVEAVASGIQNMKESNGRIEQDEDYHWHTAEPTGTQQQLCSQDLNPGVQPLT